MHGLRGLYRQERGAQGRPGEVEIGRMRRRGPRRRQGSTFLRQAGRRMKVGYGAEIVRRGIKNGAVISVGGAFKDGKQGVRGRQNRDPAPQNTQPSEGALCTARLMSSLEPSARQAARVQRIMRTPAEEPSVRIRLRGGCARFCQRGFRRDYGAAGTVEIVGAVQLGDIVLSADSYFALCARHMAAHGAFLQ